MSSIAIACADCPHPKSKDSFSNAQWKKGSKKLCKDCIVSGKTAESVRIERENKKIAEESAAIRAQAQEENQGENDAGKMKNDTENQSEAVSDWQTKGLQAHSVASAEIEIVVAPLTKEQISERGMQVIVKPIRRNSWTFDVEPFDTILSVKQTLHDLEGYRLGHLRMVAHGNKPLADECASFFFSYLQCSFSFSRNFFNYSPKLIIHSKYC